jgi:predicted ribosome quality control (RQC) complex YloA/Tae2 family protein
MLSLVELERAARALDASLRGARLERAVQRGAFELELELSGGAPPPEGARGALLLSCRPGAGRVSWRAERAPAPPAPLPFAQYLRAHLAGARLACAGLQGGDRLLALGFDGREGRFELLLQLLGPRSNVYLLDAQGRLALSLRPLEETRRDLAGGAPWRPPASAPPRPGEDRFAGVPEEALLAAIEAHYAAAAETSGREGLRRRVELALKRQRDALARKERLLAEDLAAAERAAGLGRLGELLKGALPRVPPRASEVRVADFATGEEVAIPLDPALSPAANLEQLFKRQRKAERQALRARQEQGALAERREAQERLAAELAGLDDEGAARLAERPEVARLLERYAPAPSAEPRPRREAPRRGPPELPLRLQPKRYRSSDGLEIWVGKSDEGNDHLTTRLARGKDLFFHLEGAPGSHVVLRTGGREDPPPESLLEACELAVHFSSAKRAGRASVHVAAIKDVTKPKGAKPGLVHVHRGRTIQLRRDPKRLERVLAARLDREPA